MASYIDAAELDEKIAELTKVREKMISKTARVCEACFILIDTRGWTKQQIEREQCWCDFPGTPID